MFRPPRRPVRRTAHPARPAGTDHAALRRVAVGVLACASWLACGTSPTGRTQILAFDEQQLDQLGGQAFAQMQAEMPMARDERSVGFVRCVAQRVVEALPPDAEQSWEVAVLAQQGGATPPEFFSTHPSNESRIEQLAAEAPQHVPDFQQAVERRGRPDCG